LELTPLSDPATGNAPQRFSMVATQSGESPSRQSRFALARVIEHQQKAHF
jgi:hypothetical protein